MGTVTYAAPEQLMGGDIDARADQYALAATAFHLLTGVPPYKHSNPVAVISRHLTAPLPKLSEFRPELTDLDDVLARALAKNPDERFETCEAFAAALSQRCATHREGDRTRIDHAAATPIGSVETQVAVTVPTRTPAVGAPEPKRRRRSRILIAAAVAAVLLTAIGVIATMRQPKEQPTTAASATVVSAPAASAPPRPAVLLDGTYRFEYDYEKQTINGAPFAVHTTDNVAWWAFRSSCGPAGCAATTTRLDPNNHQAARTPAQSGDYRFADGHWQSIPVERPLSQPRCLGADGQVVAGANTVMLTWSLDPQPDGALRGTLSATALTNECGFQGQIAVAPVVTTRVSDAPNGVTIADPAAVANTPATSAAAPHVPAPVLDGTYRLDFDLQNQTIDGTVTGLGAAVSEWWAFRSVCTPAGCAAAGSQLAESNQQEGTGTTSVLHFADGHWQGTPTLQSPMGCDKTNKPGREDETRLWSWDPQADGTFRGLQIGTVLSNGCGIQGRVYRTPFVATRMSDVAPSVIVADPALFVTLPN